MKPFSDIIIFVDCEFSSLNPYIGEILSIGLVKPSGEELYLELEYDGEYSSWPKEHIVPTLNGPKVSRSEAQVLIKNFIGDNKPYMISYINSYDVIYFYKLFRESGQPCYWVPIDFASILFAAGRNPESLLELADELNIDRRGYIEHNALDDARLLRAVYMKYYLI